jgi:hypothetical protein
MSAAKQTTGASIYQIKVALRDSKPPIWRRIQVSSDINLGKLHRILQVVMGWTDSHLHQFIAGGTYYGEPDPNYSNMYDMRDEKRVKLYQLVRGEKSKLRYQYDFGDSWEHELLVEKILPPEPGVHYPICLKGKRACPPEDVGGVWGYDSFLEAIGDPNHPEHDDMQEWIGGEFDPEAFDLDEINEALRYVR